ncbi:MAG TPA: addiction module protein [Candidatus Kapabacteria bacterium]|nr:addiction module protein [Candidatus Kapabacteria bacterium]
MKIQEITMPERIMLAEALWDSLEDQGSEFDVTDEQAKELDRRLAGFEIDNDECSDWTSVRSGLVFTSCAIEPTLRKPIRRFPRCIYCLVQQNKIIVTAVFRVREDPGSWSNRT